MKDGVFVNKRFWAFVSVAVLASVTVVTGLYFRHYFAVFVFAAWGTIECLLWGVLRGKKLSEVFNPGKGVYALSSLLSLYGKEEVVSEKVLEDHLLTMRDQKDVSEEESRWLWRLRDLLEFKGLLFPSYPVLSSGIREGFAYSKRPGPLARWENPDTFGSDEALKEISETASHVAALYWKTLETANGQYGVLTVEAQKLLGEVFGFEFEGLRTREAVKRLTDAMQKSDGVPFLVLNLVRRKAPEVARSLAQSILLEESQFDEDLRSSVYWIAELSHFVSSAETNLFDYDATIRHLYHLCFTYPDRAGFLEIDSKYFEQFELISELAREGFLFKESLIESLLHVWRDHEPFFDEVFRPLFEKMTLRKSKIYDDREAWEIIWRQEKEGFNREYLYVVEGNVLYATKSFEDAARLYEKALQLNPKLRSALLNSLFAYAHLKDRAKHAEVVKKVMANRSLLPHALATIGNSFVLMNDSDSADYYYDLLSEQTGWEKKAAYYRSMFYYDQGMAEEALTSARRAVEENPDDSSIKFHLSLCFSAAGKKQEALETVAQLDEGAEWIRFYKFTLERDTGRVDQASQTLLDISAEYFDDAEELEQAIDFAKSRGDLMLLRHLKG